MLEKIKNYSKHPYVQNFRDTRFLGFLVFGILALLASWSGVTVIETNYELQKQIAQLDQLNQVSQLANSNLKLTNEYYNTDTYLELQARKAFGKGAPGETLLLVPRDVALKHAKQLPDVSDTESEEAPAAEATGAKANLDAWLDFLFHRQS
jgi:cell division protein FtsB